MSTINPAHAIARAALGEEVILDDVDELYQAAIQAVIDAADKAAGVEALEAYRKSGPHRAAIMAQLTTIDPAAGDWPRDLQPSVQPEPTGQESENKTQATKLIAIGDQAELFRDEHDRPFARFAVEGRMGTAKSIKSSDFTNWLSYSYFKQYGSPPGREALGSAVAVLTARARYEGKTVPLSVRVAWHNGDLYYDLCDDSGRAVKISRDGWEIVSEPPTVFRRHSHMQAQVEPLRGGDLADLFDFLSVATNVRSIMSAWLGTAYIPDIPHPVPNFHGSKGSGKSVGQRVLRRLIDPSSLETVPLVSNPAEFAQILDHHYCPIFDNVDRLSLRMADALCRAVTGDGLSKRSLYTDEEDIIFSYRRPLLLNGVNIATQRTDWLDRSLLIAQGRIPDEARLTERELWRRFEERRPYLLGAIFDGLSKAMKIHESLELDTHPRMADFAEWGAAFAEAIGDGASTFLKAYKVNRLTQTREAVESDPVGLAMQELMQQNRLGWEGTPTALFDELSAAVVALGHLKLTRSGKPDSKDWPGDPTRMGMRLTELHSNLADLGIVIEHSRTGSERTITITRTASTSQLEACSDTSVTSVIGDDGAGAVSDAGDAGDARDLPPRVDDDDEMEELSFPIGESA